PRPDVLPVRHVVDLGDVDHLLVGAGQRLLRRHVAVQIVEAHAEVERQAPDRPLILREDAEVQPQAIFFVVRIRAEDDRRGDLPVTYDIEPRVWYAHWLP